MTSEGCNDVRVDRCPECGFDWDTNAEALIDELESFPEAYRLCLTRFLPGENLPELLRSRVDPTVWSSLEYAGHVTDVVDFYRERIERVLAEDKPQLSARRFDELADAARYNDLEIDDVVATLHARVADAVTLLQDMTQAQWGRIGFGSDGDERSVTTLVRRLVHEGHHHLLDIGRVQRAAREAKPE